MLQMQATTSNNNKNGKIALTVWKNADVTNHLFALAISRLRSLICAF
jgi:hypothetical protein